MMNFATIMREAGISTRLFPECGEINVTLYDENDNIHKKDDVQYIRKLFEDNAESYNKFFNFVDKLNANPDYLSIDVQITEDYVIVFYKAPNEIMFRRTRPLDPLDITD